MTLQEIKNEVAKEQNFKSWSDYMGYCRSVKTTVGNLKKGIKQSRREALKCADDSDIIKSIDSLITPK